MVGIDDVRRLDDGRQRNPPVGDVQRVVGADARAHAHDHADDAEIAAVVGRRVRLPAPARAALACAAAAAACTRPGRTGGSGRRRRGRARRRASPAIWSTAVAGVHLAAERAIARGERLDQRLVAALEPAHDLAAAPVARARHATRARPEVGRGQVVVATVELGVEQRLPQALDEPAPHSPAQPGLERGLVERCVVARSSWQRATNAREPQRGRAARSSGKRQELARRVHREQPPVVVEADARRPEAEAVAEAELVREAEDAVVRRQDHVVEAVDRRPSKSKAPTRPPRSRRALVDASTRTPACGQTVRRGQPEDAAADDSDDGPSLTPAARLGGRLARPSGAQ